MSEQDAIEQIIERAAEKIARGMRGIVELRVYPPDEAAELIGFRSERGGKSILEIPRAMLPTVPVTPGGKIVGYLGRDLLAYIEDRKASA